MNISAAYKRVERYQPTTWVGHWLVAFVLWRLVVGLEAPFITLVLALLIQAGVFFAREWQNYEAHRRAGDPRTVWIADGVLDMIGPVTVLGAAVFNPWVAHTLGFGFMCVASIGWVALGWSHYGSEL